MKKNKDLRVTYEDPRLKSLEVLPISGRSIKKAEEIWKGKRVNDVVGLLTSGYGVGSIISECVYDHSPGDLDTPECICWFIRRAGYRIEYEIIEV